MIQRIFKQLILVCLVFTLLTLIAGHEQIAHAAPMNVGCSVSELIAAINTANANDEADTLELSSGCVYTLAAPDNEANGLPVISSEITLNGNGAQIQRDPGAAEFRILQVNGNLTLNNVTIAQGALSQLEGAGIRNYGTLALNNMTLLGNNACTGGGIYSTGTLSVANSAFELNNAVDCSGGGGIYNEGTLSVANTTFRSNGAGSSGSGGGIVNNTSNFDVEVTVATSTFTNNSAGLYGGAIYNQSGTLTLSNSTISGNQAGGSGGGIMNDTGTLDVIASTFVLNGAELGAELVNGVDGTLTLKNSVVAKSTDFTPNGSTAANCSGTITDGGGNLRSPKTDSSCVGVFANPVLGPLQDNGGPTQTHALYTLSAAIDRVPVANCTGSGNTPQTTDQRGVARPLDGDGDGTADCDSGAFEYDPAFCIGNAPPTPKGLASRVYANHRVLLRWFDNNCTTLFRVKVRRDSTHGKPVVNKQTTTSQLKTKSLDPASYFWRVTACNGGLCRNSAWAHFTVSP